MFQKYVDSTNNENYVLVFETINMENVCPRYCSLIIDHDCTAINPWMLGIVFFLQGMARFQEEGGKVEKIKREGIRPPNKLWVNLQHLRRFVTYVQIGNVTIAL